MWLAFVALRGKVSQVIQPSTGSLGRATHLELSELAISTAKSRPSLSLRQINLHT